jgi:TonB family protein
MAATRIGDRRGADRVPFGGYDLMQLVAATRLGGVHRGESNDQSKPRAALAIKWLKPEHSHDPAIAACFTDVMARVRRLGHAGVCAIVDVDRAPDGSLFAALEWVNGKDWKRIVAMLKKQGTTMPPTLVAYVGMRAAQALEAAHRPSPNRQLAPLYHGELSGADILIGYDGKVKLTGLGSSELAAAARLPPVRTAFRAPELARGGACNAQSDVFSLGACLYQALTLTAASGQSAGAEVADKPESMIRHIVPAALLEIVRRAVTEDPGARFGSAGELATALAQWASTQSSPGDAHALATFMASLFEESRSGPMNDPRDNTPAQPARARRLAAMTRDPVPEESRATTPRPGAPASAPARTAPAETSEWSATTPAPVAPVGTPSAAVAEPSGTESIAAGTEPTAAPTEPTAAPVTATAAVASPAAAPPADESWESEPWENAHAAPNAWRAAPKDRSVTPPARPRARVEREAITSRPPAMPARARSPLPARPPSTVARVAPAAQAVQPQRVTLPLPPVSLPVPDVFAPLATSPRAAWRVPAFVAASAVLVIGALLALSGSEPTPEEPRVAAPIVAHARRAEPARPEPAPTMAQAEPAPTEPQAEPVSAATAPPKAAAPGAPPATRVAGAPVISAPRELRRAAPVPQQPARDDGTQDEPSAEPRAQAEPQAEPAAMNEPWTPASRSAPVAAPPPKPEPTEPTAAAEPAAARAPVAAPKTTVVRTAEVIAQPRPDFPTRAKRRGVTEGLVTVEYTIDETGAVRDPRVTESQPKGLFDEATLDALSRWRYRPKLVDGKPVASRRSFTFRFQ